MNEFQKGTVLITGASSGIGKSGALMLDKMGYHVFAGVRTDQAALSLKQFASSRLTPILLDITNSSHIQEAYRQISDHASESNNLVALINNAGYIESGPLEFLTPERLRYQFEVNVIGQVLMTQKFLPLLLKNRGRIINTCSPAGFFSAPLMGAYSMSKHALTAFNDTLRRELKPWGIHVILLVPGSTVTPIWDKTYEEMDRLVDCQSQDDRNRYLPAITNGRRFMDKTARSVAISSEQVAEKMCKAIQDRFPKSIYFAGPDSYFSFGIGRFIPSVIVDAVINRVLSGRFPN
jgi:NAD(P)-dependent dehydrogenase (short-subunit alcohol dehydrogenase family)